MGEATPKEITSRAGAVGTPVSALYFAGITGFSAAEITSGLATIGAYTGLPALGLNPMTAGSAGLIIAGVSVKNVADFAMGNTSKQVMELRQQGGQIRRVHLRAATRLASDIARFEGTGGNQARSTEVPGAMRQALLLLEQRAGSACSHALLDPEPSLLIATPNASIA